MKWFDSKLTRDDLVFVGVIALVIVLLVSFVPRSNAQVLGAVIDSVAQRSASHGWPHPPSATEKRDVVMHVSQFFVPPGRRSRTICTWANAKSVSPAVCQGVVYRLNGKQVFQRWRTTVRIFEDGSYRLVRPSVRQVN